MDAGCKVIYDKDDCRFYFNKNIVCDGGKEPTTRIWLLPINPIDRNVQPRINLEDSTMMRESTKHHMVASAYTITSKKSLIKYLHQCLFRPTKITLVKAI